MFILYPTIHIKKLKNVVSRNFNGDESLYAGHKCTRPIETTESTNLCIKYIPELKFLKIVVFFCGQEICKERRKIQAARNGNDINNDESSIKNCLFFSAKKLSVTRNKNSTEITKQKVLQFKFCFFVIS